MRSNILLLLLLIGCLHRWLQHYFIELTETGDNKGSEVELGVDWNTGVWTKALYFALGRWKVWKLQTLRVFKSKKVVRDPLDW